MFDYAVFIGRFSPFHNGHLQVVLEALQHSEQLIIAIGSSNAARCPRNPFSFSERSSMIRKTLLQINPILVERVKFVPIEDRTYNDFYWCAQVQNKVSEITGFGKKICLVGHNKDNTSYYLKMFPAWPSVAIRSSHDISATDIRNSFFIEEDYDESIVPQAIVRALAAFRTTEHYESLRDWFLYDRDYKKSWESSPFPPFIACVDAVVVQSGHVLLVQRGKQPGKGLWALPGGHVNEDETFANAVVRELKEETRISDEKGEIPPKMLASFIDDTKTKLYDCPYRSSRGRVVTQAYLFNLPNRTKLFRVRGDDDAAFARWVALKDLRNDNMFEDHRDLLRDILRV